MIESRLDFVVALVLLVGSLALIGTAVSVRPDPRGFGTHEQLGLEPCGYLAASGEPCPTCGMTTSFSHGVRLQLGAAWRANPAGLLLCLATLAMPIHVLRSWTLRRPVTRIFMGARGGMLALGTALAVLLSWFWMRASG